MSCLVFRFFLSSFCSNSQLSIMNSLERIKTTGINFLFHQNFITSMRRRIVIHPGVAKNSNRKFCYEKRARIVCNIFKMHFFIFIFSVF